MQGDRSKTLEEFDEHGASVARTLRPDSSKPWLWLSGFNLSGHLLDLTFGLGIDLTRPDQTRPEPSLT